MNIRRSEGSTTQSKARQPGGRTGAIHSIAAQGFSKGAALYARGRPDYPAAIQNWLTERLGLSPGKISLELGAGTGKFTAHLTRTGANVIAVEPLPEMLAYLQAKLPQVEALRGTAERIPVPDSSVDAVLCAQSFHWFATPVALAEIHRVLKPRGALGLVWNLRDETVEWVARLTAVMQPYEGDAPRFHDGAWRSVFPATGFGPLEEESFKHEHSGPPEQVIVDRVLSISFIAALPAGESENVAAQLRAIIASTPELSGKAEVTFPYRTFAFRAVKL